MSHRPSYAQHANIAQREEARAPVDHRAEMRRKKAIGYRFNHVATNHGAPVEKLRDGFLVSYGHRFLYTVYASGGVVRVACRRGVSGRRHAARREGGREQASTPREGASKQGAKQARALPVVTPHSYTFTTDTPRAFTSTSTPLGGLKTG